MENRWGMYMWRTEKKNLKNGKILSAAKADLKLQFFKKKFFLNGSPDGDPYWRTNWIWLIMKQLVIHFGDPFQYPGWPVGEPTESGELWFSNVEIQKKGFKFTFQNQRSPIGEPNYSGDLCSSISVYWFVCWRTNWSSRTMVLHCGDPKNKV